MKLYQNAYIQGCSDYLTPGVRLTLKISKIRGGLNFTLEIFSRRNFPGGYPFHLGNTAYIYEEVLFDISQYAFLVKLSVVYILDH
jgi:hypothetical protein